MTRMYECSIGQRDSNIFNYIEFFGQVPLKVDEEART